MNNNLIKIVSFKKYLAGYEDNLTKIGFVCILKLLVHIYSL